MKFAKHVPAEMSFMRSEVERIGSRLACVQRVLDACRKFGQHERSVCKNSFLSAALNFPRA